MRRKLAVLLLTLSIGGILVACDKSWEPNITQETEKPYTKTAPTLQLQHLVWIPIKDDDLGNLFRDIDNWIADHPNTTIASVTIVNNNEKDDGDEGYTKPSGALIVFR